MSLKIILSIVVLSTFLSGCSSSRVVVERMRPASISLPEEITSIEVQSIAGIQSESFKASLIQHLIENTSFAVIHSQTTSELIDAKLRGDQNRQNYKQANLIIRGSIQEIVETRRGSNGETQYLVTSRPFLELIKTSSGEVILSQLFVGTSISLLIPSGAISSDGGYGDAVLSARRVALDKFIGLFTPQKTWEEIDLYTFSDKEKFREVKSLIEFRQYNKARLLVGKHVEGLEEQQIEKGKVLFALSVIESLSGHYTEAKEILFQAHKLFPDEQMLFYLGRIEKMESEKSKVTMK